MKKSNKTVKGGTLTTRGFIKHLKHPDGFYMPVKVKPALVTVNGEPRPPLIRSGLLIFVLPGGGEYISNMTIDRAVVK